MIVPMFFLGFLLSTGSWSDIDVMPVCPVTFGSSSQFNDRLGVVILHL
jgi:hypothetical protein